MTSFSTSEDSLYSSRARDLLAADTLSLKDLVAFLTAEGLTSHISRGSGLSLEAQIESYRRAYSEGDLGFQVDLDAIRIRGSALPAVAVAIRRQLVNGVVIEAFPPAAPSLSPASALSSNCLDTSVVEFYLLHFLARGGKVTREHRALAMSRELKFDFYQPRANFPFPKQIGDLAAPFAPEDRHVDAGHALELPSQPMLTSVVGAAPRLAFAFIGRQAAPLANGTAATSAMMLATPLAFLALNAAFSKPTDPTTYVAAYTFELLAATGADHVMVATSSWAGLEFIVPQPSYRSFRLRPYIPTY